MQRWSVGMGEKEKTTVDGADYHRFLALLAIFARGHFSPPYPFESYVPICGDLPKFLGDRNVPPPLLNSCYLRFLSSPSVASVISVVNSQIV